MKKYVVAAALALLCSCTKNECPLSRCGEERVEFTVSVPGCVTKASDTSGEDMIASVQVFAFRDDGTLDAYSSAEGAAPLILHSTVGKKKIVAVVNAPELSDVKSLSGLEGKVLDLSANSLQKFVMTGTMEVDVAADMQPVTVEVARRVARICLSGVTANFSSPAYRSAVFRITGVFLTDVAGQTGYLSDKETKKYYNADGGKAELVSLLYSGIMEHSLASGTKYEEANYFYCYPNKAKAGSSSCTKLVVETTIDGKTYYYPVEIGEIKANNRYNVSIEITRPGSEDPDSIVSFTDATVKIEVLDWVGGEKNDIVTTI